MRIDSGGYVTGTSAATKPNDTYWPIGPTELRENPQGIGSYTWQMIHKAGIMPVMVYKRDMAAFCEDYITAGAAEVKTYFDNIDTQRTDDWYMGWVLSSTWIKHFKGQNILDPDIAAMVQLLSNYKNTDDLTMVSADRKNAAVKKARAICLTYPLAEQHISYYSVSNLAAWVEYLNSTYTFRQEN
jgi:hypothetical protein